MTTTNLHRQKVRDEASRRGLVSMMNQTKWTELRDAVQGELPFCPPFQLKLVLEESPYPAEFETDVDYLCDWSSESLYPFYGIEWMRIRPRYLRRSSHQTPVVLSVEPELTAIIQRYHIPHKKENDTIWIFGYASAQLGPD